MDPTQVIAGIAALYAEENQMAADPHGKTPGRFGFDIAELHLHLAEASLLLGDHRQARAHAATLAHDVLNAIPAPALRETLRVRLRDLEADLFVSIKAGKHANELRERLHTLTPLVVLGGFSDELTSQ